MIPCRRAVLGIVLACLFCVSSARKVNKHRPWLEDVYHGVLKETEQIVMMELPLIALDKDAPLPYAGEICGFRVSGAGDIPFEVVLVDGQSGEGLVRATHPLGCPSRGPDDADTANKARRDYTFSVQAYDCGEGPDGTGQKKSRKAMVHVRVKSVNRHAPEFLQGEYSASVDEAAEPGAALVRVEASDGDCSPLFGRVCDYQILTAGAPFSIDSDGVIRATERLSYELHGEQQLTVAAYDCGKRRSAEDALVTIGVRPVCRPGWQGWNKRVEYDPGSGGRALFPGARLETCGRRVASARATVELQTAHIGKGCDRETYAENSRRKLCGASTGGVDLLPSPELPGSWTQGLPTEVPEGPDSTGERVFLFDGTRAALVPDAAVPANLTHRFTLAAWLRHGPLSGPAQRSEKEAILCNSDKAGMNRHHYSLYIHNCRLVFLLRSEFSQTDTFRPAEFHWKLDQVCDKEWHHYVITVDTPTVTLYVDGVSYQPYLVTDDWPIRPGKSQSQLAIGACWHGGEQPSPRFAQFFRGDIAGFTVLPGHVETQAVVACLHACKESLDLPALPNASSAVKVHFNPTRLTLTLEVEGHDLEQLTEAVKRVAYVNTRQFPTPGPRDLHLATVLHCVEEGCPDVPEVSAYVMVLQPEDPHIVLSGADSFARPAGEFPDGVVLFPDLRVVSSVTREVPSDVGGQEAVVSEEILHNLDRCEVAALGDPLEGPQERFEVPADQLSPQGLEVTSGPQGITISGVESLASYERVLRTVRYLHNNPDSLFERRFRLTCSELNGRYASNSLPLDVTVLHVVRASEHVNHARVQPEFVHSVHYPELSGHSLTATAHSNAIPGTATVVIVLCVGFLVFAIVLGVVRARSANQRGAREQEGSRDNEMDWDDSALTITVNPMESYGGEQASEAESEVEADAEEEEEEEEEDDITAAESEESGAEEGDGEAGVRASVEQQQPRHAPREQLEWDDSTLTF